MWNWLECFFVDFLGGVLSEWQRFNACFLSSCAVAGFVLWFVPGRSLSIGLSLATVAIGTVAGVFWECRSR
jgi:hypothetical protein